MGSEVCADELMNEENPSTNHCSVSELPDETSCNIMESNNGTLLAQSPELANNHRPSIGPATPVSNRENADQNHVLSPPTVFTSPPHAPFSYSTLTNCPDKSSYGSTLETPKETLFDSFAQGPDKFMLAPQPRKYREELRNPIVRRLNFNCATKLAPGFSPESGLETSSDEERLFEIVYETILDAIFSEQSETIELGDEFLSQGSDSERPRTPKSAQTFNGVAETCPGAPLKTSSKYRSIDKEICKRLEF